jgi:hypothetical protein
MEYTQQNIIVEVKRLHPRTVHLLHKNFRIVHNELKFNLLDTHLKEFDSYWEYLKFLKDLGYYQMHHIIPLSLGGENTLNNIALVGKSLHKSIHKQINFQTVSLEIGKRRSIIIPAFNGAIWRPLYCKNNNRLLQPVV